MMEFGRRSFPLPSFNPTRQKQRIVAQQNYQAPRHPSQLGNGGSVDSQIANLKQCISAYLDSIQMVCQAGSWLAESFSFLLSESPAGSIADEMKTTFAKMLQFSLSTSLQAKKELSVTLMKLSLPNIHHAQAIKDCRIHNAKVLEKCIHCLSDVHNSFFKIQLNVEIDGQKGSSTETGSNHTIATCLPGEGKMEANAPVPERLIVNYASEWEKLGDIKSNLKSWLALKERNNSCLRKYNGLTETEVQNLVKHETVSELYLQKLNQRIDTALRNYEVGLRNLPTESTTVFGGFYSSPDSAGMALQGCCSQMEIEQGTQRLPVSQFLHCELPLMTVTINRKEYSADASNSSANINLKKNAIRQVLQSTNQKLSISETDELSSEILGDVCPARWRTQVKTCLQLLYGNSGLVIMDTMSSETNTKQNAVITQRESFVVVSVTSTWCLKEDLGTMSLLQRILDPEKTLATILVRYVSVFNIRATVNKRSHPGIFVETFVQTGSHNRRQASRSLRASQTLYGVPLTPMSACWLTSQPPLDVSPILSTRFTYASAISKSQTSPRPEPSKSVVVKSNCVEPAPVSERKRKKRLVVEIKEGDSSSEEEKSSDNDHSVKDAIQLLSGCSRSTRRKQLPVIENAKGPETDEMSRATEEILDSDISAVECGTEVFSTNSETDWKVSATENNATPKAPDIPHPVTNSFQSGVFSFHQNQSQTKSGTLEQMPIHQKSKSRTLPGSFGSNTQSRQESQQPKSSSSTLPHEYFRNGLWSQPVRPLTHHPRVQTTPGTMPIEFFSTNPQQLPQTFAHDDMPLNPAVLCTSLKSEMPVFTNSSYGLWLHGTNSGEVHQSIADHFTPTSDYNPQNGQNSIHGLLHGVTGLSVGQPIMHHQNIDAKFRDEVRTERLQLMGDRRQHVSENVATHRNSNNNNMMSSVGANPRESVEPLPHPSSNYTNGVFCENMNRMEQADERKSQIYRPDVTRTPLQDFLTVQQNQGRESFDNRNFGGVDHFMSRSQECLGPIGSPVVKRQSKFGQAAVQQPQPQTSNTWPFARDLPEQVTGIATSESEYKQYVAEVARNANLRKQISRNPGNEQCDLNDGVWDDKSLWSIQHKNQVYQSSFTGFNKTDSLRLNRECANDVDSGTGSREIKESDDASRTGTWPPWQLWPSGNALWNWSDHTVSVDIEKDVS